MTINDASKLAIGQAQYSALLYPNGTFVDDVIVHRLGEQDLPAGDQRRHAREGRQLGDAMTAQTSTARSKT